MTQHEKRLVRRGQREVARAMALHSPGSTVHGDHTVWPGNMPPVAYIGLTVRHWVFEGLAYRSWGWVFPEGGAGIHCPSFRAEVSFQVESRNPEG